MNLIKKGGAPGRVMDSRCKNLQLDREGRTWVLQSTLFKENSIKETFKWEWMVQLVTLIWVKPKDHKPRLVPIGFQSSFFYHIVGTHLEILFIIYWWKYSVSPITLIQELKSSWYNSWQPAQMFWSRQATWEFKSSHLPLDMLHYRLQWYNIHITKYHMCPVQCFSLNGVPRHQMQELRITYLF